MEVESKADFPDSSSVPTASEELGKVICEKSGTVSTVDTVSRMPLEAGDSAKTTAGAQKGESKSRCLHNGLHRLYSPYTWILELYASFGKFIPFAILTYGINQSIAWAIGGFAIRFYMKDVLGLDGATMGRVATAASLPWSMKPFMGMLSDGIAFCGYHRRSYIVLSALLGLVSYVLLGTLVLPLGAFVVVKVAINLSISTTDVIVDGKAAELSRQEPRHASDLQSLMWGVSAVFGLMSSTLKGPLLEWSSPQVLLLCMTVCSVSLLIPTLLGWLSEERIPGACCSVALSQFRKHPSVLVVAILLTLVSSCLSFVQVMVPDKRVRAIVTVICAIVVGTQAYRSLKQITPYLGRTALFIFLRGCLQGGLGETMFKWLTDHPGGPQLSPTKLGFVDCFGSLGLVCGITIYNKYMTNWSFRRIFLMAQLTFFFAQLLEIVLVMRWNLVIGIPDFLFLVGDDTFAMLVSRFFFIPMLVLAAKVCPPNLEATLFATLISLSNFGGAVSGFMGVTHCELWGLVGDNFDNLPYACLAKASTALLPIPLIFMLVPTFTPNDNVPEDPLPEEGARAVSASSEAACQAPEISEVDDETVEVSSESARSDEDPTSETLRV